MAAKQVLKWHKLDNGQKAGKWCGHDDVRGYQPPKGYAANAIDTEYHPVTGKFLNQTQWWIILTPKG